MEFVRELMGRHPRQLQAVVVRNGQTERLRSRADSQAPPNRVAQRREFASSREGVQISQIQQSKTPIKLKQKPKLKLTVVILETRRVSRIYIQLVDGKSPIRRLHSCSGKSRFSTRSIDLAIVGS